MVSDGQLRVGMRFETVASACKKVADTERGMGGKALIQIGIKDYLINKVCVNEQNPKAKKFYENNGFHVYKRTELDEQGNPYPLLFMKI